MSEETKDTAASPEDFVYVRHLARSPKTRSLRAARSGHRRQGVILGDGTRLRRKGKRRMSNLTLDKFAMHHTELLEHYRVGTLEFYDSMGNLLSYDDLKAMVTRAGAELDESGTFVDHPDSPVDADKDPTRVDLDTSELLAKQDQFEAKKRGEANPPPSEDEEEAYSAAELKKMSREALDELAEANGMDPADYSSKGKLINALLGEE